MPICVKIKCPHCEKEFDILLQGGKVEKGDKGYCTSCNNYIDIFSNCVEISIDHSVLKSKMEELAEKIGKNELTNPATVLSIVAKCCEILLEAKL
jgi:hypothetical protein